ncbi:MAG TPA: STAS domain-containing protein [bacterium]|nr:STAS domain-containing protein [bacterium]
MKNLTVNVSTHPLHKDITVLSVKGFIDTNTAPEFDKTFQSALAEKKYKLVVDLKDVTYVSSAGWGLFVGEIKRIRGQKGDLFLTAMSPEVEEAYELLQFGTILKAFPNVEQAVQKGFRKSAAAQNTAAVQAGPDRELQPVGKSSPGSTTGIAGGGTAPAKELSKPHWFKRMFNPLKWF